MNRLHLYCPINQLSYGTTSLNILKLLNKKLDVTLWPIGQVSVENQEDLNLIQKCYNKQQSDSLDLKSPSLKIYHQNMMAERIGQGKFFGFPFFELNKFTKVEKENLNSVDHLFVTSKWGKDVCLNNNIEVPISIIPLGINIELCNLVRRKPKPEQKNYIFSCIGKWEIRKGFDVLYKVFDDAFNIDDKVELWLMPTNIFNTKEDNEQWEAFYLKSKMGQAGKVKILPFVNKHEEVLNIINQSNCGVYLSRAEGWNLGLMESLALGKSCIATNYSAHTEYITSKNCDLIDIDELEESFDNRWFFGQGNWAKFDKKQEEQTIEYMRKFYKNWKEESTPFINKEGIETAKKFTWANTVDKLLEVIQ